MCNQAMADVRWTGAGIKCMYCISPLRLKLTIFDHHLISPAQPYTFIKLNKNERKIWSLTICVEFSNICHSLTH